MVRRYTNVDTNHFVERGLLGDLYELLLQLLQVPTEEGLSAVQLELCKTISDCLDVFMPIDKQFEMLQNLLRGTSTLFRDDSILKSTFLQKMALHLANEISLGRTALSSGAAPEVLAALLEYSAKELGQELDLFSKSEGILAKSASLPDESSSQMPFLQLLLALQNNLYSVFSDMSEMALQYGYYLLNYSSKIISHILQLQPKFITATKAVQQEICAVLENSLLGKILPSFLIAFLNSLKHQNFKQQTEVLPLLRELFNNLDRLNQMFILLDSNLMAEVANLQYPEPVCTSLTKIAESQHPYAENINRDVVISIPGASCLFCKLTFPKILFTFYSIL